MDMPGTACRIVEFGTAHPGPWNMACDEWLLQSAIQDGRAALRVYAWSRPTVSLGYFQQPDDLDANRRLEGIDRVRRLSGGGAIVHHHEWTYSCAVPPDDARNNPADHLYTRIHQALVDAIDEIATTGGRDTPGLQLRGQVPRDDQPALCFARAAADDVVCTGHKVLGSAQRRRRGAVLQHGSLLLERSPHAPEFPGLIDLVPELTLPNDFPETMATAIAAALQWRASLDPLSKTEEAEIRSFADELAAQFPTPSGS